MHEAGFQKSAAIFQEGDPQPQNFSITNNQIPGISLGIHKNKTGFTEDPDRKKKTPGCFLVLDSIDDLMAYFHFRKSCTIFENDLDSVNHPCDINRRKRRDAEVLSIIAANAPAGKMLDIGTHLGRSAARMAVNSPQSMIYTVNIHPDDARDAGLLVTDILSEKDIGRFYRERKIQNIQQVYANTKYWRVPEEISDLSIVYVDGCHDTDFVISDTKLLFHRVRKGGFILWHDFTPIYRENFSWIDTAMRGVEQLIREGLITGFVLNVRNSWVGIWQKG